MDAGSTEFALHAPYPKRHQIWRIGFDGLLVFIVGGWVVAVATKQAKGVAIDEANRGCGEANL